MVKFSIRRKIFIGFFTLIILSASFLLISFPSLSKINILSSKVVPLSKEINILQNYIEKIKHLENKTDLYLTIKSDGAREELTASIKQINELVDNTMQKENTTQLKYISGIILKLNNAIEILIGYIDNKESAYRINLQILAINKLFETFEMTQEALQRERLEQLQEITNQQKAITRVILDMFLLIEISIIVFGFLASYFLSKLITRNLSKLHKGTQEIAKGNFQTRIDVSSKDEIGQLANSFNMMADDLRKKTVSKEYVDNIIRSMGEPLIILNPDMTINSVNKATDILLGYEEGELIGKSIENILSQGEASLEKMDISKLINDANALDYEINYRAKDSKSIPVLFKATVMKAANGEVICVICTAADITKRKQIEEKLKEAMEIKSKFTSMVSHELRTPLAVIKTGINIILDELAGSINNEQREFLNISRNNVDRLVRLIHGILDFQKLESGKVQLELTQNNINEIIKEVYAAMRSIAEKKGLKFTLELDGALPQISLDKDSIVQVLSNLIDNAVKFTEKGGISIAAKKEDGIVHIKVSDTGRGIKEKDIHKLFSAFTRIEAGRDRKIEGTGLGLVICKEIIEKHSGKIWVESEDGKGSVFHLTLPCVH